MLNYYTYISYILLLSIVYLDYRLLLGYNYSTKINNSKIIEFTIKDLMKKDIINSFRYPLAILIILSYSMFMSDTSLKKTFLIVLFLIVSIHIIIPLYMYTKREIPLMKKLKYPIKDWLNYKITTSLSYDKIEDIKIKSNTIHDFNLYEYDKYKVFVDNNIDNYIPLSKEEYKEYLPFFKGIFIFVKKDSRIFKISKDNGCYRITDKYFNSYFNSVYYEVNIITLENIRYAEVIFLYVIIVSIMGVM